MTGSSDGPQILTSSAYKMHDEVILSGRSFINSRNSRGPRIEPCGTPLVTPIGSQRVPFILPEMSDQLDSP